MEDKAYIRFNKSNQNEIVRCGECWEFVLIGIVWTKKEE